MKALRVSMLIFTFALSAPLFSEEPAAPPKTEQHVIPQPKAQSLDLKKIFGAAPLIYSLLLLMSTSSVVLWLYTLATFRPKEIMPKTFIEQLRRHLDEGRYAEAAKLCQTEPNLLASIIGAGLSNRRHGPQVMIDSMKSEGKRASANFWQRLALLNDIAVVAPMLGLLGTVIGMFYAFYDVNRSIESINALFDGLGIAVGTTVVGLIVAILSMVFSTTLKYRLVLNMSLVENEAISLGGRIESKLIETT